MRSLVLSMVLLTVLGCGRDELYRLAPASRGVGGGSGGGGGAGGGTGGGKGGGTGGGGSGEVNLGLTQHGGCGDTFIYAANPDDTVMVTLSWPNRIAAVKKEAGIAGTFTVTLPLLKPEADAPAVTLHRGKLVRDFACSDIVQPGSFSKTGSIKSGSLKLEITITDKGPFGTMTLENAVFVDPAGGEVRISKLVVGPVFIGWLPG